VPSENEGSHESHEGTSQGRGEQTGAYGESGIHTAKIDPTYDDLPEFRYHFPQTYRRVVEAAVGDWIIYYEPRRSTGDTSSRGGRQAYFATARVSTVQPDLTLAGHFYAFVQGFLEFPRPVPFKNGERFYESALRRSDGNTSKGAFGRSVRPISDSEYGSILGAASAELLAPREPSMLCRGSRKNLPYSSVLLWNALPVGRFAMRPFRRQCEQPTITHAQ
jgi:hypothetical protein